MSLLVVNNLEVAYGAISALKGISLNVQKGEVVALIGTNGAGKTTLLNTLAGILKARAGEFLFMGKTLNGLGPEDIIRKGLALVPEGRRIFPSLSVRENLRLGAIIRRDTEIEADIERMTKRFPILEQRIAQAAGTLSGGEQQQLAIARALMSRPKLLMLDEPSLGLAPILVDEIFDLIAQLKETDVTILIVEQNAKRTLKLADRAYVLNTGIIEHSGAAQDIREQVDIKKAYLGA